METLVAVRGLSRYYRDFRAVNNLSFELKRGQVLGFLGPNGAGKTTTMQMLSGALAPSAGEVQIAGYDLLARPQSAKAALGYLPEQPPLYPEMRVREYLQFCARLRKVPPKQISQAIVNSAAQCGIADVLERLVGSLSKGFQQRVGIAQAIIHAPSVVILDEPTVGLDPLQIRDIRSLLRRLGEEQGVILSTHILSEAQAVCSHALVIHQGQLVFSDALDKLQQRLNTACLRVGWRQPPSLEVLQHLDGISAAEALEPRYFRLYYQPPFNPAEMLVEKSVSEKWGLFELSPEQRSLEQIFIELTET